MLWALQNTEPVVILFSFLSVRTDSNGRRIILAIVINLQLEQHKQTKAYKESYVFCFLENQFNE